jgi:hypothetical protein
MRGNSPLGIWHTLRATCTIASFAQAWIQTREPPISSKKALRRQRAERAREQRIKRGSEARTVRVAIALTVALVVVVLVVAMLWGGGQSSDGRVWSEAHGHWHNN